MTTNWDAIHEENELAIDQMKELGIVTTWNTDGVRVVMHNRNMTNDEVRKLYPIALAAGLKSLEENGMSETDFPDLEDIVLFVRGIHCVEDMTNIRRKTNEHEAEADNFRQEDVDVNPAEVIAIAYEISDCSCDDSTDFDEAIRIWCERNGVSVLTAEQELALYKALQMEFGM